MYTLLVAYFMWERHYLSAQHNSIYTFLMCKYIHFRKLLPWLFRIEHQWTWMGKYLCSRIVGSFRNMSRSHMVSQMLVLALLFEEPPSWFPWWPHQFTFPPAIKKLSSFPMSFVVVFLILILAILTRLRCQVIYLWVDGHWCPIDPPPKAIQTIAIAFDCPLEIEGKTLLLKISDTWEIKLVLTWKYHYYWLS